jgi:signal transduction histidine kinase
MTLFYDSNTMAAGNGHGQVWRRSILPAAAALLLSVLAINIVSIISIVNTRRAALAEAMRDLQLDTVARARGIEAALAGCRADLAFLAATPPLVGLPEALPGRDVQQARWKRLDAEGSLVLFLASHPEVERLVVRDGTGRAVMVAGRKGGAPQVLPTALVEAAPEAAQGQGLPERPEAGSRLGGRWPLAASAGSLEAVVDIEALLRAGLPADPRFSLHDDIGRTLLGSPGAGARTLRAEAALADEGWLSPVHWVLERWVEEGSLAGPLSRIASSYRWNLIFNVGVMLLALGLGGLGLRQAVRSARLEEQAAQQARVRELERQLYHSERLSTVGRLAAGLAHEVNNPLEGMTNYMKILEEDLAAGRAEEARRIVPRLQEGLGRAAGIARQVLQFSNPSQAPMAPVDLAAVLSESLQLARANRGFQGIEFVSDLPSAPPVTGNRLLLGQLFLNLILNACQAQPDGGTVEVGLSVEVDRVVARVADRGPGVPEADRERIFEPFYSSRNSTGLGLSVCRAIAEQHGAELRLGSRAGGGAEFSLALRKA